MNKSLMNIAAVVLLTSSFMFGMGKEKKESKHRKINKIDKTIFSDEKITVDEESQKPALPKSASESESLVVPAAEQYYDATETPSEEKQVATEEKKEEPAVYEQPIGPEPKPVVPKSTFITSWMKTKCLGASNLTKAQYYLENTANRDPQTRKEIGSRIGDAISETIAQIEALNRPNLTIQEADGLLAEKQMRIKALEKVLRMALEGEEPVEVDSGLLVLAAKALQKTNNEHKEQVSRIVKAGTTAAHTNKALAFLICKKLHARGNFELNEENLSARTYENEYDLLDYVGRATGAYVSDDEAEDTSKLD